MNVLAFMILAIPASLVVVLVVLLHRRSAQFNAASAPAPSRRSRRVETIVLGCAAGLVLLLAMAHAGPGGVIGTAGVPWADFVRILLLVTAAAVVACAGGLVLAYLYRTWAGALALAVILLAYNCLLGGPLQWHEPSGPIRPLNHLVIELGNDSDGADLWVNDVHLGRTPIITTVDEFLAKVPVWKEPPAGFTAGERSPAVQNGWLEFKLVNYVEYFDPQLGAQFTKPTTRYYARAKLGDEPAEWTGGSGGGGGGGRASGVYHETLGANFPERDKKVGALIDRAKADGGKVGGDWFDAMAAFGRRGWNLLRLAADKDSRLAAVVDAWVARQYGLDAVTTPDAAWQKLQEIMSEADRQDGYATDSPAGRAVELVAARLDPERLARAAVAAIDANTGRNHGYSYGKAHGRPQFSCQNVRRFADGAMIRPSGYVLAHAVWLVNERLGGPGGPVNPIQREVVPELLRRGYQADDSILRLCLELGGPDIERFLLRQDWRSTAPWPDPNAQYVFGKSVNRWLLYAAWLRGPQGLKFRMQHAQEILTMAAVLAPLPPGDNDLGFLFLDPQCGQQSLAWRFWPEYVALTAKDHDPQRIRQEFAYLARMEPVTTVDLYVQAWRSSEDPAWLTSGVQTLQENLPPARRRELGQALLEASEQDLAALGSSEKDKTEAMWLKTGAIPALKQLIESAKP